MRAVALLVVLAGCDRVFDLKDVDLTAGTHDAASRDGSGSGSGDAARPDVPPPLDAAIDAPPPACPMSYQALGNHGSLYKKIAFNVDFNTARGKCNADSVGITRHTHLAVLDDDAELATVHSNFTGAVWIGLVRIGLQNAFQPVTTQMTAYPPLAVPPWAAGNPTGAVGENCVQIQTGGGLDDILCTSQRNAVCECDDFADDPTH